MYLILETSQAQSYHQRRDEDSYLAGMFWERRRAVPPASMGPPRLTHLYDGDVSRIESPGRDRLRHVQHLRFEISDLILVQNLNDLDVDT